MSTSAPSRPVDPALAALSLPTPNHSASVGSPASDSSEPFGQVLAAECADQSESTETPVSEGDEVVATPQPDPSLVSQILAPYLFAPARFDLRSPVTLDPQAEPEGEEEGIQALDTDDDSAEGFLSQTEETESADVTATLNAEGRSAATSAFALVAAQAGRGAGVKAAATEAMPTAAAPELTSTSRMEMPSANAEMGWTPVAPGTEVRVSKTSEAQAVAANQVLAGASPAVTSATALKTGAGTTVVEAAPEPKVTGVAAENALSAKTAEIAPRESRAERSGVKPLFEGKKDKILNVDKEILAKVSKLVGTDTANQGETSMSPLRSNALEPLARAADFSAAASQGTESVEDTKASLATRAVSVVEDIREVSAGLNAHRRHVDLNFDFGGQDRLSVRVDVRNGEIQTQFRTDSTELRDALQQAWNSQGLQQEGRARLAEPVFLPAASRDSSSNQSFADAQARQQRQAEAPVHTSSNSRGVSSAPVSLPLASSSPVVASDRQLHVFA